VVSVKLSEAMMLPTDMRFNPSRYIEDGCGCLLGQAFNVATGEKRSTTPARIGQLWPWINEKRFWCPSEVARERVGLTAVSGGPQTAERIITRWAFLVKAELATREQVADWVRSVEPSEPNQEQPGEGVGTHPTAQCTETNCVKNKTL
jgi:hypothetical protein